MQYARTQPKLPASETQTSICLPANGAIILRMPMSQIAVVGVLYFG